MDPTAFWTALGVVVSVAALVVLGGATVTTLVVSALVRSVKALQKEKDECCERETKWNKEKMDLLLRLTRADAELRDAQQVAKNLRARQKRGGE